MRLVPVTFLIAVTKYWQEAFIWAQDLRLQTAVSREACRQEWPPWHELGVTQSQLGLLERV